MKKIFIFLIFSTFLLSDINIYQKEFSIKKPIKSWIEFKNENLVRQEYDYSCGSAALATILKYYYNLQISEKDILDSTLKAKGFDISNKTFLEDGQTNLSFLDLSEYANKIGFKGVGLALDMQSLQNLQVPVILFVKVRKDEHFTVYKSMDTNYVYLADPSFGNIKVSIAKFQEMFFQREDLKYPGKILALIPLVDNQKELIKYNFRDVEQSSNFIYDVIRNNTVR